MNEARPSDGPALRVAVFGNGAFGTALALHARQQGHDVTLWGHDAEYTARIAQTRRNPRYLPGIDIPPEIRISTDTDEVLEGAELLLLVVPTQHLRGVFERIAPRLPRGLPIVSCAKGLEEHSGLLPSDVIRTLLSEGLVYVLSGPCHAEELARGMPTVVVLAGPAGEELGRLQVALAGPMLRIYRSTDPLGVEYGGALKNVIAIAAGMSDGLELGDNAKSALLTRGLAEISRFGERMGADRETFWGLAGMGDLITTSVSPHGRNRELGVRLGRGETLAEILSTTRKATEGVWTCRAVLAKAEELGLEVPITAAVAEVLFAEKAPAEAMHALMGRVLRPER